MIQIQEVTHKDISLKAIEIGNLRYEIGKLRENIPIQKQRLIDMEKRLEVLPALILRAEKELQGMKHSYEHKSEVSRMEREIQKLQRKLRRFYA